MKKQKYIFATVLLLMAFAFSCTDTTTYPLDFDLINNSNAGTLGQIEQTSITFDKFDLANAFYEVLLEANDRDRGKLFTKMDLYVKFRDLTPGSTNGDNSKDELLLKTYVNADFVNDPITGLPRKAINATATETLALLGLTNAELEGSDQFIFRQAMVFPDGRVFTSTNVQTAIAGLGGVYKSPFQNVVSVVCPSDLGGIIHYVTVVTGSVVSIAPCQPSVSGDTEWKVVGPGIYDVADATFGQYDCAWNDNPAAGTRVSDACGILNLSGTDQYGLIYTFVINQPYAGGNVLRINWSNDYGDVGYSDLTRTGKTWPAGLDFP